jgi:alpha-D-xyloside xylohydrolase
MSSLQASRISPRSRFFGRARRVLFVFGAAFAAGSPLWGATGDISQDAHGVTLETASGLTRVEIWGDRTARVIHTPTTTMPTLSSLAVTGSPANTGWQFQNSGGFLLLSTPSFTARVEIATGRVTFLDAGSAAVLAESASGTSFQATTVGSPAVPSYVVKQNFDLASGEAIYGLGQHQQGIWNYVGQSVTLLQKNMEVGVPVWLSSKGYAVLWDNPSVATVDVGKTTAGRLAWNSEAGDAVDYYFCYGPEADTAIAGYRTLTGAAPMFGKWAWGFWQCKERYQTQQELLDVASQYRTLGIPIDGIIQDWRYWPDSFDSNTQKGGWGSHDFDPSRYPDPAALMSTLHSEHIHTLISVWAKFDVTSSGTSIPNLQQLEAVNGAYPQVIPYVYPAGQGKWYDPFQPAARSVYWQEISQKIFAFGWDGWWLDASEPELSGKWGEFRNFNTAVGTPAAAPGAKVFNAYPLMHTTGVYEGQRAETSQKRAIILTRSAYAGQQRNAAITWSGDISGSWSVFAAQIPAGLNFVSSGIPYWNTDIGGFGSGDPSTAAYAELFTRWFQYGAFCPMFRVHGTNYAKEVWRFPTATQPILINYINLRYRLLPYIYSVAWKVTNEGYTMMRPLVMDFRADAQADGIGNQFLFGPSLMVNPVTTSGATSRSVYLPAGATWFDFWTGATLAGGQTITANAPIETMPLYARAGSIVPMGPTIQYAMQSSDPVELRVYPGANGSFTLYEDEGDNYDYESGARATIPFTWDDGTKTLTIGARQGSFPGMLAQRTFRVVFVRSGHGVGVATTPADVVVTYDGSAVAVPQPSAPAVPPAPTSVSASVSNGHPVISWDALQGSGEVFYHVRRALQSGGPYTEVASGVDGTSFTDTTAPAGSLCYYVVSAENAGGEGPISSEVSVTSGAAAMQALLMFNESGGATAADATGNGWNGSLVNSPTLVAGKGGNAVSLNGTNQYVSLPTGAVASLNNFTISAWVNPSTVSTWSRVFDFGTGTTNYMFLTPKCGGTGVVRFAITNSGGSGEQQINGQAALPAGAWTHVAVTLAGNVGILYVNGVEVGRNSAMTLQPFSLGSTTQNWIGRSQFSDPYLSGLVDDFRIYSGALSAGDVQALANGTASALRSPWTSQDIGSLGLAGSSGSPANNFYVTASGSDIWGASDNFHYVSRSWTGDVTVTARVKALTPTNAWSKAGIMIRGSLAANAANAFLAITPGNGVTSQSRSSNGGSTGFSNTTGLTAPYWLRMQRVGNDFSVFKSPDGVNWTSAGATVTLGNIPSSCVIGLALTSHDNTALAAAQFDHVTIVDTSLAAPTGLAATVTNGTASTTTGTVSLSWQATAGATGYTVKRATASGGPYATIAEGVASPNYTDTVTADGTTYYYVVSSTNEDRASVDSSPVSATVSSDFQQWKAANGLSIGIADTATPDHDGVSVLMKYALGLSIGTPAVQPAATKGASALELSFTRRSPAPVNYTVEAANAGLSTWMPIASLARGSDTWTGSANVQESGSGGTRSVTITDPQPMGAATSRFLRLRVDRSTP